MHYMNRNIFFLAFLPFVMAACADGEKAYDATGTFEATETTIIAEQSGTLLTFSVSEGDSIAQGQEVALIDTTQTWLKMQQLVATRQVYESQKPDMERQTAATRQQLSKARQEEQRYRELVADGAAPRKMLDDAKSQVLVLQKQLEAQLSTMSTQVATLNSQSTAAGVQIEQLRDMLRKCHVTAPTGGTVLEKYAERGEFVTVGKPLLKVADVQQMYLRAYVTSAQLQHLQLGQQVTVFADYGAGQRRQYDGTIVWVSSRSEFTPKTILTDDERADLVYAVKIGIRNDGFVKIGMYGQVKL